MKLINVTSCICYHVGCLLCDLFSFLLTSQNHYIGSKQQAFLNYLLN